MKMRTFHMKLLEFQVMPTGYKIDSMLLIGGISTLVDELKRLV